MAASEPKTYQELQQMLDDFCEQMPNRAHIPVKSVPAGQAILDLAPSDQVRLLHLIQNRRQQAETGTRKMQECRYHLFWLRETLVARKLPFAAADLEALLDETELRYAPTPYALAVVRHVERWAQSEPLTDGMRVALKRLQTDDRFDIAEMRRLKGRVRTLLGDVNEMLPEAADAWGLMALTELAAFSEDTQTAWKRLFFHAATADGSKPTGEWSQTARTLVSAVGNETFWAHVIRWFPAVTAPGMTTVEHTYEGQTYTQQVRGGSERNVDLMKGLAWCCATSDRSDVARALAALTEGSLKKVPGIGPWAVRSASAAVYALGVMPAPEAVTQLSRLKNKVTFRTTLTQIEKALDAAAVRAGLTKDELEDLAVPGFGLDPSGARQETFGEYVASVALSATGDVLLTWRKGDKAIKSVPADVKKTFADEWKAFKADVDGLAQAVSSQRGRLDRALFPVREWKLAAWRERYLDHPVLSHLSRRLIWEIVDGEQARAVLPTSEALIGLDGAAIIGMSDAATVRLWHPLGKPVETVLQWREMLEARAIAQPFKQAHREVYLLTDAERQTATYSNRFAGHILKQHQMNALAAERGWQNKLRLMVDDSYPPATRDLPTYDLRAEFWIEGAGDDYQSDITDSGAYLRLTTDQVRFYRRDAPPNYAHASGGGYGRHPRGPRLPDPVPLTEVDPLAFSEVMRDVDLFVGVASVGNDPTWQDGGPEGRYRSYWYEYSFGNLSATAKTRAETLTKLLPRLKIRDRATIDGNFLRVRGDLRTYKIHLGSGNILMEPDDQYLCIVEDRRGSGLNGDVFLPFEGDARLSVILSKAFLLAGDKNITDTTITRQIRQ